MRPVVTFGVLALTAIVGILLTVKSQRLDKSDLNLVFSIVAIVLVTAGAVVTIVSVHPFFDEWRFGTLTRALAAGLANVGAVVAVAVLYADAAKSQDGEQAFALGDTFRYVAYAVILAAIAMAAVYRHSQGRPRAALAGDWPQGVYGGGTGGHAYYALHASKGPNTQYESVDVIGFKWDEQLDLGHALVVDPVTGDVLRATDSASLFGDGWRFVHLGTRPQPRLGAPPATSLSTQPASSSGTPLAPTAGATTASPSAPAVAVPAAPHPAPAAPAPAVPPPAPSAPPDPASAAPAPAVPPPAPSAPPDPASAAAAPAEVETDSDEDETTA